MANLKKGHLDGQAEMQHQVQTKQGLTPLEQMPNLQKGHLDGQAAVAKEHDLDNKAARAHNSKSQQDNKTSKSQQDNQASLHNSERQQDKTVRTAHSYQESNPFHYQKQYNGQNNHFHYPLPAEA